MSEEPLTWVLLVPLPARRLADLVKKIWQERFKGVEMYAAPWEVLNCKGRYSAVLDRNPGSELTHEEPLIRALAREAKDPIYLLYLNDEYEGANVVVEYRNGRKTRTLPDGPYAMARRFGCMLPGDAARLSKAAAEPDEPAVFGVIFAEGAKAREVARALELEGLPSDSPLRIEDSKRGTIIYNREEKRPPAFMMELSEALPDRDIYELKSGPEPGSFYSLLARAGEFVGEFILPKSAASPLHNVARTDSVKGQKEPAKIAEVLGIPGHLFNLKEPS